MLIKNDLPVLSLAFIATDPVRPFGAAQPVLRVQRLHLNRGQYVAEPVILQIGRFHSSALPHKKHDETRARSGGQTSTPPRRGVVIKPSQTKSVGRVISLTHATVSCAQL